MNTTDRYTQGNASTGIMNRVHFAINWNSAANNYCATSLCTEMILLKDKEIADMWLSEDLENREVFNIDEAIDFSSQFFRPLLDETESHSV